MKISNIVTTGLLTIGACATIGLGISAIAMGSDYKNNNVVFQLDDKKCFVRVDGSYSGPTLPNGGEATYSGEYTQQNLVNNEEGTLNGWNIGNVTLTEDENSFSLTITITNLGTRENDDIDVSVSNIAYDNVMNESNKSFLTECTIDNVSTQLIPISNSQSAKINTFELAENSTVVIKLSYTLANFKNQISGFPNNITIAFDRVSDE